MKINRIAYPVLTFLMVALLVVACQGGQETATEETVATSEPPAETEAPPETSAPPPTESTDSLLTAALSELQGLVEMKQADEDTFSPASSDSTLKVNGQIQTGDDGKARLDLSSGTIVRVSPSSLFTLTSNEEVDDGLLTKIKLELGQIFVILNGGSLDVDTPSGVASVRGSYLKVEFGEDDTLELTCLEGDCSVLTPTGETIHFTDGQKVVVRKDPETGEWIVDEGPMNSDDFNEWLENNPEALALVNAGLTVLGGSGGSSGGSGSCVTLTEPPAGADFFTFGGVDFGWTPKEGAATYVVTFTYPSGIVVQFSTSDTSITRYIESMPPGGSYTWDVTAYDESGNALCTSDTQDFTKDDTTKWKEENRKKEDGPACDPCNYYGACYSLPLCEGY